MCERSQSHPSLSLSIYRPQSHLGSATTLSLEEEDVDDDADPPAALRDAELPVSVCVGGEVS